MSRTLCKQCNRPSIACICHFVFHINNPTHVLVLQHPSEVKQTKGTVNLLSRSLENCQVIVGEDFSNNPELNALLANHQTVLLYPSEKASVLSSSIEEFNSANIDINNERKPLPKLLIILDGTWKKAYKMFMLSSNLQELKQVCLPENIANRGQYLIRKVAKNNALSSLEACCYALALLEGELDDTNNQLSSQESFDCGLYQNLLNKFIQFNQFQLSFRPSK